MVVRIDGFDVFYSLSKELKKAGDTGMRTALNKEIRTRVKPLIPKTRAVASETLPKRGGLAKAVARTPQRVVVKSGRSAKTSSVQIVVPRRQGVAARGANAGVVRHPVFQTGKWVDQKVPSGWFEETLAREAPPVVEAAIRDAVQGVLQGTVPRAVKRTRKKKPVTTDTSEGGT